MICSSYATKQFLHAESVSEKIAVQMITLIALSRFIAMEANYETRRKEQQ
jgi:hypothetical protein